MLQTKRIDSPQTSACLISSDKFYNIKQSSDDKSPRPKHEHSLAKDQQISIPLKVESKLSLFDELEKDYWKKSVKSIATEVNRLNSTEQKVQSSLFDSIAQIQSKTVLPQSKPLDCHSSGTNKRELDDNDQLRDIDNVEEDKAHSSSGNEIIPGTPEPPKRVSKLKQSKLDTFLQD